MPSSIWPAKSIAGPIHRATGGRSTPASTRPATVVGDRGNHTPAGPSSAPRRWASTATTAATCCARTAPAAAGSTARRGRRWRTPPVPPPRRPGCGSSRCAPPASLPRAAVERHLRLLRPLFSAGLGGRLGTGGQWLSWVGIDDLLDIYYRASTTPGCPGRSTPVGPNPVRNSEYTRTLAATMHRPRAAPGAVDRSATAPRRAGRARTGRRPTSGCSPTRLQALGHRFRHSTVEDALAHQLGHDPAPGALSQAATRCRLRSSAFSRCTRG